LLVAYSTPNVRAAKQATTEIPILMLGVIDPVRRGLVASLAHPGGNVTGLTDTSLAMEGKRLELLKKAVPKLSRVAVQGGSRAGARPHAAVHGVRAPEELESAFTAMTTARAEALFMESTPFWRDHIQRLVGLAAQRRLPAVYYDRGWVKAGGLMSYGTTPTAASASTWTRFSTGPSRGISPWSGPPRSSCSSTSRLPRPSN
ncbi:MAG TPA: ABC transporter substrate-binding protein, partial [Candidatus Acidoferrum sp.]|nr:ABC transporter substrate-binding protein [Candidatus Acidoferrum sp.]